MTGNIYYILRLKSLKKADMNELDMEKKRELAKNSAYRLGYALFNNLKEKAQKELQDKGRIKKNEEYLAIDKQQKQAGT